MDSFKFGHVVKDNDGNWTIMPYYHPDAWAIERTKGPNRLVIAPNSGHIDLLLELTTLLPEPFIILYVLLISTHNNRLGRYQSPSLLGRKELEGFFDEFGSFLERDGRHHVWVMSLSADLSTRATLVYNHHNVIYAYGPLGDYERLVRSKGLEEHPISFPFGHTHEFRGETSDEEQRIMSYWEWVYTPLQPGDDE